MIYTNKIKDKIKTITNKLQSNKTQMILSIVDEYRYFLQSSKISGVSFKYITYSILEGVDEALDENIEKKDKIFQTLCSLMADEACEIANKDIKKIKSSMQNSDILLEKIDGERANLEDIADAFKEYIVENGHEIIFTAVYRVNDGVNRIKKEYNLG